MNYLCLKSGTDIRGVASVGVPNEPINLTNEAISDIAAAFLLWCEEDIGKPSANLKIAIGHDSRISSDRISSALISQLYRYGVHIVNCGLSSTPAMFMSILHLPCDCAIQITASHHPYNRNGFKFFTRSGGLDSHDIVSILELAGQGKVPNDPCMGLVDTIDFMEQYSSILRQKIIDEVKTGPKPLTGFKIAVDAGNGAGGFYAHRVLCPLGADISGSRFLDPDGMFPNHIPNPEDSVAMRSICEAVKSSGSDLGVIFDTDVDRAGAVDAEGNEINRNRLVALASSIALEGNPGGTIVTDSITSDGLKLYIEETLGGVHHRYQRGYRNVINEAMRLNLAGINCPLAIETSGHAAMRENHFLDDGAYLVTKIIIKMAALKQSGKTINSLLLALKEPLEVKEFRLVIQDRDFKRCGEEIILSLGQYALENDWCIAEDNREGLRVSFDESHGNGWFLLRLSVHDPIMPLNIESDSPGGISLIISQLFDFLILHESKLEISSVRAHL